MQDNRKKSETIYYIKGLSILSVICAHCNAVLNTGSIFAQTCSTLLGNIGTFGVICFFMISGGLFHFTDKKIFFKKKLVHIVVPWIISATCVFLYVRLRKPPLTITAWFNFVIGNGSYCYYLTMLMLFYVLFVFVSFMQNEKILILCIAVTVVSLFFCYNLGFSPYMNPLNWIGYFAGGMIIRKHEIDFKVTPRLYAVTVLIMSGLLIYQVYMHAGGYFGGINVLTCWSGALVLLLTGKYMGSKKDYNFVKKILKYSGEKSYFIYLWHMPVAGIIARIMNIKPLINFVLLRPLIILGIVLAAAYVAERVLPLRIKRVIGLS